MELGRRKDGVLCGMGCCSCLALMRGRVLLDLAPPPGKDMPFPNPALPFLTTTPPRRERLLLGLTLPDMYGLLGPRGEAGMV